MLVHRRRAGLVLCLALCTIGLPVSAEEARLLLRFTQGSDSFREILREAKGASKASHKQCLSQLKAQSWDLLHISAAPHLSLLKFDSSSLEHAHLSEALTSLEGIETAEQDHQLYALDFTASRPPNDPLLPDQYGMPQLNLYSSTAAANLAQTAWAYTQGSSNIIVCVIDSGIDYTHPDLAANIWTNPREIPDNGIDDDKNGYVDDVHGWNVIKNSGDMRDDFFHGSHLAGIVGASCNDGIGVCGVSPKVSLMGCKFLDGQGSGYTSDAIRCLQYALTNGAHITLNSYGAMNANSAALSSAVFATQIAGQLFVTAAGNDFGANLDKTPVYPASYNFTNVVAVIAVNESRVLPGYSNFGATSTDIAAPGSDILSTELSGEYGNHTGTSQSAAFVAGAAVLLLSVYQQAGQNISMMGTTIRQDLTASSSDPLPGFSQLCASGGTLNVGKGVAAIANRLGQPFQAASLATSAGSTASANLAPAPGPFSRKELPLIAPAPAASSAAASVAAPSASSSASSSVIVSTSRHTKD
ncbi:hypothetical protein WJX74_010437 [Apatococcus lobatus]|uniref:Peptidase S8/S53 domain-containing protein n=1 Tax=Apatococcus lobatus TaxID=904363 RepID=A0AAW1Q985_9CHLO